MAVPTPSGQIPAALIGSTNPALRSQGVADYVQLLTSAYGSGAAQSFQSYVDAHPGNYTLLNLIDAWGVTVEAQSLTSGLDTVAGTEGTSINQLASGAAAGLEQTSKAVSSPLDAIVDIWNTITSRSFMIRLAEGVLGGLLIIIAIDHMTGLNKVAAVAAKVIP
jgi:hypothetical protein